MSACIFPTARTTASNSTTPSSSQRKLRLESCGPPSRQMGPKDLRQMWLASGVGAYVTEPVAVAVANIPANDAGSGDLKPAAPAALATEQHTFDELTMLILRGVANSANPRGQLDDRAALEYARRMGYRGEMLDRCRQHRSRERTSSAGTRAHSTRPDDNSNLRLFRWWLQRSANVGGTEPSRARSHPQSGRDWIARATQSLFCRCF